MKYGFKERNLGKSIIQEKMRNSLDLWELVLCEDSTHSVQHH